MMGSPDVLRKARVPGGTQEAALVSAMIVQAIKDMRSDAILSRYSPSGYRRRSNEYRVKATTWLGSKAAQKWFDLIGVDQVFALHNMYWVEHARALLNTESTGRNDRMTQEESSLLKSGIDFLTA